MRNLGTVIDNIIRLLPDNVREDNIHAFKSMIESIRYSAPEMEGFWWQEAQSLISSMVKPIPTEDWEYAVISEFTTVPVEKIKQDVADFVASKERRTT